MEYIEKISRQIPVAAKADVIVAGGGPAGVCAAIAAARNGADTVLLESSGCLGGTWTAGCLGWIIDSIGKKGLVAEIIEELKRSGCSKHNPHSPSVPFNPEGMKLLLEDMCLKAKVRIRLHTMLTDVIKDDTGNIIAAVSESKSGCEAWKAKIFIDASGDGDLAARSGCEYDIGNEDKQMQPMSLLALITGIDPVKAKAYINNYSSREQAVGLLLKELRAGGVEPSYLDPTLFHLGGDIFFLMSNHQYNYAGINANDLTEATISARKEVNLHIDTLRKRGGIWKNIQLAASAEHIGVREGRRIKGLYKVTLEDLKAGTRHADAVCRPTFCIDVHALDITHDAIEEPPCKVKAYDIPLRALISADVNNLLMAGRCISGDFYAHASYRVTGNAAVLGEAAGTCAALAAEKGLNPGEISNKMFFTKYKTMPDNGG